LNLKIQYATLEAQAEVEKANAEIKNEEERATKIKEIRANLAAKIKEIGKEHEDSSSQRNIAEKELATTQMYERGEISKREYETKIRDIGMASLESQREALLKAGEDTIEIDKKISEKRIEIAEEEAEQRKEIFEALYNAMNEIVSLFFDAELAKISQEMEDLQHYYTTDAEEARKNADKKYITEEEMQRRQLELKRKQAQAEKNQSMFNAGIQMAEGIVRIKTYLPLFRVVILQNQLLTSQHRLYISPRLTAFHFSTVQHSTNPPSFEPQAFLAAMQTHFR
ncbi:hypothetical protein NO1_2294, partial [Candidatus Termititenax aidoneus]